MDKVTKRTKAVVQQHDVGINNNATLIRAVVNSTGKDDCVKLKQDGSRSRPSTSVPKEVPTEVPAMSDSERARVYFLQGEEPNTTPKSREKTPKKNQRVFGGKSLHNRSNRSTQGDDHDGIDLNVDPSDDNFREDTSDEESSDGSSPGSDSDGDGSYLSDGDYSSGQEVNVANAVISNSLGGREDLKKLLRENQDVQDLVKEMVAEEVKEQMQTHVSKKARKGNGQLSTLPINPVRSNTGGSRKQDHKVVIFEELIKHVTPQLSPIVARNPEQIKSPSDSTLYTPALKKGRESNEILNKITNFVESIQLGTPSEDRASLPSRQQPVSPKGTPQWGNVEVSTCEKADNIIVQMEQFRANISAPKGRNLMTEDNDDDFFHITCHVDPNLTVKIQNGEFIELDKLLPKERGANLSDDNRLELVTREGMTYFAPAQDRTTKITGLRKWEQAFRVYAAIYTQKHPEHVSEIWQDVYVINLAASSFQWENVSFYDVTFRHLMALKPNHSWAKTYVQGWNLAMTDPVSGCQKANSTAGGKFAGTSSGGTPSQSWRDNCCWCYNRNKCKKYSAQCDWDHRCTYCGGWNHSYANCRKRLNKDQSG